MAILNFKRKEVKYLLTLEQYDALLKRVDSEIEQNEFFFSEIRNLYLDTPNYQLIRTSIAKPKYKEKLRIRSYGDPKSSGKLFYEIKKKYDGIVYKRRFTVETSEHSDHLSPPLLFDAKEFGLQEQTVREWNYCVDHYPTLLPRYFVSYERYAYVGVQDPEFRVTFDQNLTWRSDALSLTGPIKGKKLLPNQVLMEIKVPGAMPLWMARPLSELGIFPMSFSKIGKAYEKSDPILHDDEMIEYV